MSSSPRRRRALLVALVFASAIAGSVPSQGGEERYVVSVAKGYYPGSRALPAVKLEINKGDTLKYRNFDATDHNVTSSDIDEFGFPLFRSATVTAPDPMVPVEGVAALTVGSYEFYCTIHPAMQGVLEVLAG